MTEPETPLHQGRPAPVASRVRALSNFLTLLGGIAIALGWAMHWEPYVLGRLALATLAAFLVSFVAILVENRAAGRRQQGS